MKTSFASSDHVDYGLHVHDVLIWKWKREVDHMYVGGFMYGIQLDSVVIAMPLHPNS